MRLDCVRGALASGDWRFSEPKPLRVYGLEKRHCLAPKTQPLLVIGRYGLAVVYITALSSPVWEVFSMDHCHISLNQVSGVST